jgi:HK97 family phage prohead protease
MRAEIPQRGEQMKVRIREDCVEITGYVNAIERNSKPLLSRVGRFIERICQGAFASALKRNDDVHVLLNHDWGRNLGSTRDGNLELCEDSIGLHARAIIYDTEVMESAKNGDLVGWSFGFTDTENGVEQSVDQDTGLPLRKVRDLNLYEVSILDKRKTPAYEGTLIQARSEDVQYHAEPFLEDVEVLEERAEDEPQQDEHPEAIEVIDYSKYEGMIAEMKGAKEA